MKRLIVLWMLLPPQDLFSQNTNDSTYQIPLIRGNLPPFSRNLSDQLTYPLSWLSGKFSDFTLWRSTARAKVKECLLKPPSIVPFAPVVMGEQDRGGYVARKIMFHITADSRVLGYLLLPKGKGHFPAVLLLHDHGGKFDIGKEKVVKPFDESPERIKSAQEWVEKLYGGRFIGDELARRGYVCFATDALNWSDRGGAGYEGQQALASNLFNLGMSFAGLIAWEDLYSAEFLAAMPEVDSQKVIAMGLSMGSFRAWQVAALSDKIAGCVAVCWMGTRAGLLVPGGNLTRGQSSFTTTHPGISNYLDYPDVASIACPKPMLFYNGEQDKLFPVPSVQVAYTKMRKVWDSQSAGDKLVTKFWNAGHEFNREMQEEAFQWLDQQSKK
jgi:dienelactone hydrolase